MDTAHAAIKGAGGRRYRVRFQPFPVYDVGVVGELAYQINYMAPL